MYNIDSLMQHLEIWQHLTAFLLGMPRLFLLVTIAPFFGASVVTGQLRAVIVIALYLPLHPLIFETVTPATAISTNMSLSVVASLALLMLKEVLLGLFLGFLVGIPFWMVQSAGALMDNQRGASNAENADILTGDQSSPMGQLLFQCLTYILYTSGSFLIILGIIYASYEIWPITQALPVKFSLNAPIFFAERVNWLVMYMLLLAGPIVAACLLTDISLGIVNRFASQLNVYVIAMPIKSGLASFLLCFYLALILSYAPELFSLMSNTLIKLPYMLYN